MMLFDLCSVAERVFKTLCHPAPVTRRWFGKHGRCPKNLCHPGGSRGPWAFRQTPGHRPSAARRRSHKGLSPPPPQRQSRPPGAYPGRFPLPSILSVSAPEYEGKGEGCRGGYKLKKRSLSSWHAPSSPGKRAPGVIPIMLNSFAMSGRAATGRSIIFKYFFPALFSQS